MIELENRVPYLTESCRDPEEPPELFDAVNIFLSILGEENMSGEISFQVGLKESRRSIEIKFGYDEDGFLTQTRILRFNYLWLSSEMVVCKWNKEQQKFEQALLLPVDEMDSSASLVQRILEIAEMKVETEDIEDIIEQLPKEVLIAKDARF